MDFSTITIATYRLQLLPLANRFAEDIFNELTPEVTKYLSFDPSGKIEDTFSFIEESASKRKEGKEIAFAISEKQTQAFVGCCGIHEILSGKPELGIWIKKSKQGKGYGKEVMLGLIDWANANLTYNYLIYPVVKRNIPSRKLIESLGGIIEKEKVYTSPSGKVLDEVEYRIYRKSV